MLACKSTDMSSAETWDVDAGGTVTPFWSHLGGDGGVPTVGTFWPTGHAGE